MELGIGLNNMHSKIGGFHANCDCRCVDICGLPGANQNVGECCANHASFSRITNLWIAIVCPKANGQEWHKRSCLVTNLLETTWKLVRNESFNNCIN